ncbi:hypothetical protein J2X65_003127 [Ancylobacter sp. 3268]|uniref:hypothetical protein n=1 Tax=Ancylobacter sp. 3268 TaxID=2817752 RepID=UPI002855D888|nr:hypothetical protein [Ancylobacter sp. 3268]MDR6953764.1 hypothetical protein [Ancylobacter sp. 3268]
MESYDLELRRFAKDGDKWVMSPDHPPESMQTWSNWSAFIPQPRDAVKKKVDAVRIAFRAEYIAVEGGTVIMAGYNDIEKIVKALHA